jgi:hypothetical protein
VNDKPLGLTNDDTPTDHHLSSLFIWEFALARHLPVIWEFASARAPSIDLGIRAGAGTCENPACRLGGGWAGSKKTLGDRGEFPGSFLRVS